jgi:hypothetical protein
MTVPDPTPAFPPPKPPDRVEALIASVFAGLGNLYLGTQSLAVTAIGGFIAAAMVTTYLVVDRARNR